MNDVSLQGAGYAPQDEVAATRRWLGVILCAFLLLGVSYVVATPPLESSDEYKHYPVVQHIQTTGTLVILDADEPGLWLQEGAQPPLYYVIMAGLTRAIDTSDLADVHTVNPHTFVGNPNQLHNKNLILHNPDRPAFLGSGAILAINVIRLVSLLFGIATLVLIYQLGVLVATPSIGLAAAALTAFTPMFLFIHAAVNNDSLATLMGTVALYGLVWLWQRNERPNAPRSLSTWRFWWPYLMLGIWLGLALLTKLSAGAILGLTGVALAWQAWRQREWRYLFAGGLSILIVALLISGWWFWRNWQLYGDVTGLNVFVAVQGVRAQAITWADWVAEFGTFYRAYWGLFGGVNVGAPAWFYLFANGIAVLGAVGLAVGIVRLWHQRQQWVRSGGWLLAAWSGMMVGLLIRWVILYPSFQGRLLFPAIAALHMAWAAGFVTLFGRKLTTVVLLALFVVAAVLPWSHIRPAYAFPQPLSTVPNAAQIEPVTFQASDGVLQLVGVGMAAGQSVTAGGRQGADVTLYWTAPQPPTQDYLTSVHLLGRTAQSVGQSDRYPGWGMIPTSRWEAGQIWEDTYRVFVSDSAESPARLRFDVNLFDVAQEETLPKVDVNGNPLELLIVGTDVRLAPADTPPAPTVPLAIAFNDGITLDGHTMADTLTVGNTHPITLTWSASATPSADYTVFVHLIDDTGTLVANADAPPVGNAFPTSLWRAGDSIADVHMLFVPPDLPSGDYRLQVGLYDPETLVRVLRNDGGDASRWTITVR